MSQNVTWLEWSPLEDADAAIAQAQPLLTRDNLLTALREDGVSATGWDLSYWQGVGAVPYPIRRWHNGAVRALYPQWMTDIVRTLRLHQQMGTSLSAIGRLIRATYPISLSEEDQRALILQAAHERFDRKIDKMRKQLDELVRAFEAETGTEIGPVDITIHSVRT